MGSVCTADTVHYGSSSSLPVVSVMLEVGMGKGDRDNDDGGDDGGPGQVARLQQPPDAARCSPTPSHFVTGVV